MDKIISINHETVNRQFGNLQKKDIIYCWETYNFCFIKISGNKNECLQFCLNAFDHDVDDLERYALGSICNMSYE